MTKGRRESSIAPECTPTLFDRLVSPRDGSGAHIGRMAYQRSVIRDLSWLLNSTRFDSVADLESFPGVAGSVLNYGIPAAAGVAVSEFDLKQVAEGIRQAILRFEPRVLPDSLEVSLKSDFDANAHNRVCFGIRAALWFEPRPLDVAISAQWDAETGTVQLREE